MSGSIKRSSLFGVTETGFFFFLNEIQRVYLREPGRLFSSCGKFVIEPGEAADSDVCGFQRLFKDATSEQYAENNVKSADSLSDEAKTIFYLSLSFFYQFHILQKLILLCRILRI